MSLPDVMQLTTGAIRTSGINAASVAAGANCLGSVIDNSSNLDFHADVELVWSCSTAPTADRVLEVYLLYALDGTNFEDGDASTDPRAPVMGAVPVFANTSVHRFLVRGIPLEPLAFKVLVKSRLDQAATITVNIKTYREQVVD